MDQETYVPGMNEGAANVAGNAFASGSKPYSNAKNPASATQFAAVPNAASSSPVVGFLYSLSNGGAPEFWSLKIGRNTIGKSADNDIVLHEGSVSAHHACISVKMLRKDGRLVASITDVGSSTGLILNDEELDYEQHTIRNEDIITVGLNYKLVAMLVDPTKYGLSKAEEFIDVESPSAPSMTNPYATSPGDTMAPENIGSRPYSPQPIIDDATININGGPDISGGGTKIL